MGRGGGGGGGVEMEEELQDTQVHIGFTQILFLYTICMHPPPLTCLIYTLHIVHFTFKVLSPQHGFPCSVSVHFLLQRSHVQCTCTPPHTRKIAA